MKALLKSEHFAYTSQNLSLHAFLKKSVAFLVQDLVVVVTNCPFSSFFNFFFFFNFLNFTSGQCKMVSLKTFLFLNITQCPSLLKKTRFCDDDAKVSECTCKQIFALLGLNG